MTEPLPHDPPAAPGAQAPPDDRALQERRLERFRRCGTDGAPGELFRAVLAYERQKVSPP